MKGFPCPLAGLGHEVGFTAPACERAIWLRIKGQEGGAQVPHVHVSSGFVTASTRRVPLRPEAPSMNYLGPI